jgi:hypothetical protein
MGPNFKFNLAGINLYNLVRLEESRSRYVLHYRNAYRIWRNAIRSHENAHFNMIERAINGPETVRNQETLSLLTEWTQRPTRDAFTDLRSKYPAISREDRSRNPIPVAERVRTDFLWQRSPFLLFGRRWHHRRLRYRLYPAYWMARYYRL